MHHVVRWALGISTALQYTYGGCRNGLLLGACIARFSELALFLGLFGEPSPAFCSTLEVIGMASTGLLLNAFSAPVALTWTHVGVAVFFLVLRPEVPNSNLAVSFGACQKIRSWPLIKVPCRWLAGQLWIQAPLRWIANSHLTASLLCIRAFWIPVVLAPLCELALSIATLVLLWTVGRG